MRNTLAVGCAVALATACAMAPDEALTGDKGARGTVEQAASETPPLRSRDQPQLPLRPVVQRPFTVSRIIFHDLRNIHGQGYMMGNPPVAPSTTWNLAAVAKSVPAIIDVHLPSDPSWLQSGYCSSIAPKINGVPVTTTSFERPDKYTLQFVVWLDRTLANAPSVVSGSVTCGGGVAEIDYPIAPTAVAVVKTSAFAAMNDAFDHPRCTTCHSLGNGAAWKTFHANFFAVGDAPATIDVTSGHVDWLTQNPGQSIPFATLPYGPFKKSTGELVSGFSDCTNCHQVKDWRAPPFSQGTDWEKVVTATDRCNVVASHLPTSAKRYHHFHEDPRLLWSYYDGKRNCIAAGAGPVAELDDLPKAKGEPMNPDFFFDAEQVWTSDTVFDLPSCANLDMPRKLAPYPL